MFWEDDQLPSMFSQFNSLKDGEVGKNSPVVANHGNCHYNNSALINVFEERTEEIWIWCGYMNEVHKKEEALL
jgi:hypothetical protein